MRSDGPFSCAGWPPRSRSASGIVSRAEVSAVWVIWFFEFVMYATALSVCFFPFHFVMKSTGMEFVSILTSLTVPWRTCARMCAQRRSACLALPGVAVPSPSVRFAELSVPMMIGLVGGWPNTRKISVAYTPSCAARSVATLSLPTLPSSSMISTTVEIFLTA